MDYIESSGLNIGDPHLRRAVYFNTAEQLFGGNYKNIMNYLRNIFRTIRRVQGGRSAFYLADSTAVGRKEKACACYEDAGKYLSKGSFAESAALGHAVLSWWNISMMPLRPIPNYSK